MISDEKKRFIWGRLYRETGGAGLVYRKCGISGLPYANGLVVMMSLEQMVWLTLAGGLITVQIRS